MLEFRLCIKVILRILDEIEAAYTALYLYFTEIGLLEKIDLDLISLCSTEICIRRMICYQFCLTVGKICLEDFARDGRHEMTVSSPTRAA